MAPLITRAIYKCIEANFFDEIWLNLELLDSFFMGDAEVDMHELSMRSAPQKLLTVTENL